MIQMNLFTGQKQTHRPREGTSGDQEGRKRGRDSQEVRDRHVHTMGTNKDLLYSTGHSAQCYVAAWMGGEFGENAYMYMNG